MNREFGAQMDLTLVGWASPKLKWFNLVPFKFNERKRNQAQSLIEQFEIDGYKVLEQCSTPFLMALKIVDTKIVEDK